MPRDASGSYTLPAGNPVVTGSIIQTSWANPTMDDIRTAMTDSLSRSGKGGMLAPFTVPDGSNINPSLSFVNEATSGIYRFANNDIRMAIGTTDRMRWQGAGTPPQIYDEVNDRWNDLGAGGVEWSHAPVIPAEVEQGVGYMTNGGQSTNMPPSPITGQAVTFADLDNDWSATNFLTINGNGNTFTQGNQAAYELDLKGAYAQFAYLDGQWQIVNFGRLSDAYGFDLDDYALKTDLGVGIVIAPTSGEIGEVISASYTQAGGGLITSGNPQIIPDTSGVTLPIGRWSVNVVVDASAPLAVPAGGLGGEMGVSVVGMAGTYTSSISLGNGRFTAATAAQSTAGTWTASIAGGLTIESMVTVADSPLPTVQLVTAITGGSGGVILNATIVNVIATRVA